MCIDGICHAFKYVSRITKKKKSKYSEKYLKKKKKQQLISSFVNISETIFHCCEACSIELKIKGRNVYISVEL